MIGKGGDLDCRVSSDPLKATMPTSEPIELVLSGIPLQIVTSSARLRDLFTDYFRYYADPLAGAAPLSKRAMRLELHCPERIPLPEELLSAGARQIAETGVMRFWEDGGGEAGASEGVYIFHVGVAAFRVDMSRLTTTGWVAPGAFDYPHILANTYALFPILLMLRAGGRYHLHAAAVISPRGRLWLITGAQRSGKTSLTTALGLAGWRPISDDSLLLMGGDGLGPRLESLRKYFHLGDALLARWEGLARMTRHHQYLDRTCVGGLEFFDSRREAGQAWPRVDYVVLPRITGEARSRLAPVAASEVRLRLAEQSVYLQLWRRQTVEQWGILEGLMRGAKGFQLDSGLDLLDDPGLAARLLMAVESE